ncbi:MAG: hypothetical protein J2P25_13850, partial [Nocardiopsaceae bacterium]|nr:hypothetical protein [Nocardiopsaceae bacterium]
MSSAILYVAIVAIWACVLIPRWLRRGTVTTVNDQADHSPERVEATPRPSPSSDVEPDEDVEPTVRHERVAPREPGNGHQPGSPVSREPRSRDPLSRREEPREEPRDEARRESRQQMLAARRRMLFLLLALEAAATALTVLNLAALWVLIPPTIMLAGYLLLLREAAHADAERAAREAEAEASR